MENKQLTVAGVIAVAMFLSGCLTTSTKNMHAVEASLSWYAPGSGRNFEDNAFQEEYQKKINQYLRLHPQTSPEIAGKMKSCRVILGMSEEQVLLMAKPNRILKSWFSNKKLFKYSDVGKFGWTKFIGEGIKVRITLIKGIVTNINEIDTILGG
jgi:hypothetical protein